MPTLSETIAHFVASLDFDATPAAVQEKTRVCLLNGYGIAMGGLDTPYAPVARAAALAMDGERTRGATLLGDGRRTSASAAMLANAALFHGRAQEDTCGTVHLGAIVIPMLTAMIEAQDYPVERLLPALLIGYEVAGLFDVVYGVKTAPMGLRASPLYGTLGAAAAAGKLMGLNEGQLAAALANAASFTGGILQSFADGTDEWRYQVGIAARNGFTAAELARHGSVSAPRAFEGGAGFVRAYVRTDCDVDALARGLGTDWSVMRTTFKPYPVCAFNQTPVTAALALNDKVGGRAPLAIRVRMNPYETGYAGMTETGPFNSISGTLMSIPFCIAVTMLYGVPDMGRMTTYDDPAVAAFIDKVSLISDQQVPNLSAVIEVDLAGGETIVHEQRMTAADFAFDRAGVSALIRRIGAEQGVPADAYDRLESFVARLPTGSIHDAVGCFAVQPVRRNAA